MLESLCHVGNSFATLTYEKDRVDLVPKEAQDWLKRLRRALCGKKVRYFLVGEYGDRSQRPHYHAALFGLPSCSGRISARLGGGCECPQCSVVRETWGFGHVMLGRLEVKSAQYIAGYVTKKMTDRRDPRLAGRHPEFARMSLKPGIGADAMWDAASVMMQYGLEKSQADVPLALRFGSRQMPLGRYLRGKLREMVDLDKKTPEGGLQEAANRLQIVRAFAFANSRSVQSVFEEVNSPYAHTLAAREVAREAL